jgi:diguanylate cyclase (GGDEF)-like protein
MQERASMAIVTAKRRVLFPLIAIVLVLFIVIIGGIRQFWLLAQGLDRQSMLSVAAAAEHDQIFQLVSEETGVRGYVATANPIFLQDYDASRPQVDADEARVLAAVRRLPELRARIGGYRDATAAIQRYFSDELLLVRSGKDATASARLQQGRVLFDRLRQADAAAEMQANAELSRQRTDTRILARAGVIVGLIFCGLLLLWSLAFLIVWLTARDYRLEALRDPLTGATNRQGARSEIERLIRARSADPFGLVFIDLDGFKKVNDVYGHAIGDAILRLVAARLRSQLRDRDQVCRIGGDEFVCIVSPPTDIERLRTIGVRLQKAVSKPYNHAKDDYVVGCSVGISLYPQHGNTVDDLLQQADQAMYRAKARGGGVNEATAGGAPS